MLMSRSWNKIRRFWIGAGVLEERRIYMECGDGEFPISMTPTMEPDESQNTSKTRL